MRGLSIGLRRRRLAVAGLAAAGFLDSLYMLAYTGGLVRHLRCPFFGAGCDKVGRSRHAEHLGVPNSAVGAVGYAAMAAAALWAGSHPIEERPWQPLGLGAMAGAAGAVSAFLTWEQPARVGAFCFWCLTSAAINAAIVALSAGDAARAARTVLARRSRPGTSRAEAARAQLARPTRTWAARSTWSPWR